MQGKRSAIFISIADLPREFRIKGVFELPAVDKGRLMELIKLDQHMISEDIDRRAKEIAQIAQSTMSAEAVIDLPAIFISSVEHHLFVIGIQPLYAIYGLQRYEVKEKKNRFEDEIDIRVKFSSLKFEKAIRRI